MGRLIESRAEVLKSWPHRLLEKNSGCTYVLARLAELRRGYLVIIGTHGTNNYLKEAVIGTFAVLRSALSKLD